MTMKTEIEDRLRVLVGQNLSGVNRAANMLTLGFGPQEARTNFYGKRKYVSRWALHVQCPWAIMAGDRCLADNDNLQGTNEEILENIERLQRVLLQSAPLEVKSIEVGEGCQLIMMLSRGFLLIVNPDSDDPEEEDWRFFSVPDTAKDLVIKGARIAPASR